MTEPPVHTRLAPAISEAVFMRRIMELCAWLGLRWHHETDSRRTRRGFPDLVIVGPGGVIFAELKKGPREKLTPEQRDWLLDLRAAGVEAYVWRPHHWAFINRRLHRLAGRPVPREYVD